MAIAPNRLLRVRVAGLLILGALACATAAAAQPVREPNPHADAPAEAAGGPLELVEVTLGQVGTDLLLRVRTAGGWNADQLSTSAGRAICIRFFFGAGRHERSRICVVARWRHGAALHAPERTRAGAHRATGVGARQPSRCADGRGDVQAR